MRNDVTFMLFGAAKSSGPGSFWSTLLGAVVGGAVSLGTTLLVERQRSKAAGKAEDRRTLADARLAARVVVLELRDMESVLRVAIGRSPFEWPPTAGFEFQTTAWKAHADQLGAIIPDAEWDAVAAPYSSFEYSNLLGTVNDSSAQTMLKATQDAIAQLESWLSSAATSK
jgi:hypothetical protein